MYQIKPPACSNSVYFILLHIHEPTDVLGRRLSHTSYYHIIQQCRTQTKSNT